MKAVNGAEAGRWIAGSLKESGNYRRCGFKLVKKEPAILNFFHY